MTTTYDLVTQALAVRPPVEEYGNIENIPAKWWSILTRQGGVVQFTGKLLASTTSHRPEHTHPGVEFAPRKYQCSACRWFRPSLWRLTDGLVEYAAEIDGTTRITKTDAHDMSVPTYVLQTSGISLIPDETERSAVTVSTEIASIIRTLVVTVRSEQPYLPEASIELLTQVADLCDDFDAVYDTLVAPLDRRH